MTEDLTVAITRIEQAETEVHACFGDIERTQDGLFFPFIPADGTATLEQIDVTARYHRSIRGWLRSCERSLAQQGKPFPPAWLDDLYIAEKSLQILRRMRALRVFIEGHQ